MNEARGEPPVPLEIETAAQPRFAVIWLHGLGADGSDFVPVVPMLGLPATASVRFIFPHAPMRPVTCNAGYVMRAWYDIRHAGAIERGADTEGIRASRETVRRLIAREAARGVPSERIVIAGFSQGGAIAYMAGLTHPQRLAGIVALSTYVAAPELLAAEFNEANRDLPVFAGHGSEDDVVPLDLGVLARQTLPAFTDRLEWRSYPMAHSICPEEIADVGRWLALRMLAAEAAA